MKYTTAILFSLLSTFPVLAQLTPLTAKDKGQVILQGNASLLSTALPVEMTNKFIYGGFITDEMKNNGLNKHGNNNFVGIDAGSSIQYLSETGKKLGIKNGFWGVSLATNVLSYNNYSSDLFNLVFFGNEPTAGTSLNFDNNNFETQWYHELSFTTGAVFENIGNGKLQVSINPGFLGGVKYQSIRFEQASLLTETTGASIDASFKGNYTASDTSHSGASPLALGGKFDLNLVYETDNSKIGFSVEDFGWIGWNTTINYELDSSFTFNGFAVDDVFNIQDTLLNVASLQDSLLSNTPQKMTKQLPTAFKLYFEHTFKEKIIWKNWVQYRIVSNYIPFLMTQINYQLDNFTAGASAAYGGYGGFQAGIALSYDLEAIKIDVGTTNVIGFFGAKSQTSQNIFGRVSYLF